MPMKKTDLVRERAGMVEAIVDPNEPPLPPKITREQAVHFAEAVARGEPNGLEIIKTALGTRIRELV